MPDVLDRRLVFVTGKGGVGKSTVATALGVLGARRGLRTIVAELASQQRVAGSFARSASVFEEIELAERLYAISIDPQDAMEEYLRVKTGPVGQTLGSSRVFQTLAMATPGMRELLSIGKVWELAQLERRTRGAAPYDLVIVDAPASGHGVGILSTPATFAEIARVGPVAHQAGTIAATIADRTFTAVIAVATAEEMPVNETLALEAALATKGLSLDLIAVNGLLPRRFSKGEMVELSTALGGSSAPAEQAALLAARSEHVRAAAQQRQRRRLRSGTSTPLLDLPYVFAERLGEAELGSLADALAAKLTPATRLRA